MTYIVLGEMLQQKSHPHVLLTYPLKFIKLKFLNNFLFKLTSVVVFIYITLNISEVILLNHKLFDNRCDWPNYYYDNNWFKLKNYASHCTVQLLIILFTLNLTMYNIV